MATKTPTKTDSTVRPPRGQRRGAAPAPADVPNDDARPAEASSKKVPGKGWGAVKKASSGGFAEKFTPSSTEGIVRFLEPEPFAVFGQHWLDGAPATGVTKKKSFACLEDLGDDDPLDDALGDRPAQRICFNIVDFEDLTNDDDTPKVKVWEVGPQVADIIKKHAESERTSPISDPNHYFAVQRTSTGSGNSKRWSTTVSHVKSRDLEEDFGVKPLDEDWLAEYAAKAWPSTSWVKYESSELHAQLAAALASQTD